MQHSALVGRGAWLPLLLASGACSMDLSLGDLSPRDHGLIGDDASGSEGAPTAIDGALPTALRPPDVSIAGDDSVLSAAGITGADLDADGFDDLAIASSDAVTNVQYLHVRYGGPRLADDAQAFAFDDSGGKLVFPAPVSGLVSSVSSAGDVDGDGYADLFLATTICAGLEEGNGGYLIYGGPERFEGVVDISDVGSQFLPPGGETCQTSWPLYSFAAPGDIDGDGFADLVFAHVGSGTTELDAVTPGDAGIYIFYGRAQRFAAVTPWTDADAHLSSALSGDRVRELDSFVVHAAGDLDADGCDELVIDYGPPGAYGSGGDLFIEEPPRPHELIVLPGSTRRLAGDVDVLTIPTRLPGVRSAIDSSIVTTPGDLDGDGFDDLVAVAASDAAPVVFYGAADFLAAPLDLDRATARLLVGDVGSIVPLGDVDGDGDADLGVARYVHSRSRRVDGTDLAVLSGSRTRLRGPISFGEPSLAGARIYVGSSDAEDRYQAATMPIGDLDGDGAGDLVTSSARLFEDASVIPGDQRLHIHYGTPASVLPSAPR
jgi:hypothetical protein